MVKYTAGWALQSFWMGNKAFLCGGVWDGRRNQDRRRWPLCRMEQFQSVPAKQPAQFEGESLQALHPYLGLRKALSTPNWGHMDIAVTILAQLLQAPPPSFGFCCEFSSCY